MANLTIRGRATVALPAASLRAALRLAQTILETADLRDAGRLSPSNAAITAEHMQADLRTVAAYAAALATLGEPPG